jgi:hypothetical protein
MPNKFEEQITDATPVEEILNPLDEAVNEKVYAQSNMSASMEDLTKPIEEPRFTAPPLKKSTPNIPQNEEDYSRREPINPEMKQLPKKETKMASKQAAALILKGYEWVHALGNKGLQVSERKLNKLQAEGEINLNAMIDYDYGKKIRAGEFFEEYNKQVDGLLKVSEEFKEEVTPVLERVLEKRGIGLTDEQTLMYMFGQDIAVKSIMFMQQKGQLNYMIQSIKEATSNSIQQAPPPPPPPPQTTSASQNRQEPQESRTADYEDFTPQEPEEKEYIQPLKRRGRPKKEI